MRPFGRRADPLNLIRVMPAEEKLAELNRYQSGWSGNPGAPSRAFATRISTEGG